MACIIKLPNQSSKGVVSITNIEFNKIKNELALINRIKKKWILLYHPNYYDYKFKNNNIFDSYLAWGDTFKVIDDDKSKILNLSCHNFAPNYFQINSKKVYDFVGLSKLQTDKGNPKNVIEFLKVIKDAMKLKKNLSGVLIISVPGIRPFRTNYIRSEYNKIFTYEEKKNFEFITLDYDIPFPLSIKTLSVFYSNSKVHLNTHPKEKHGRAQTYALSSGLPIVGFSNLSYLVEEKYRKKPYYFLSKNFEDMPKKLIEAISYADDNYEIKKHDILGKNFRSKDSYEVLRQKLKIQFNLDDQNWIFADDWDIRLAKHHLGFQTKNSYNQSIKEFLNRLDSFSKDNFISEDLDDLQFIKNKSYLNSIIRLINFKVLQYVQKILFFTKKILKKNKI